MNEDFENTVWAQLLLCAYHTEVNPDTGEEKNTIRVLHNVAYSYSIIKAAAKEVKQMEQWSDNAAVQNLKFSDGWVGDFLERRKVRRRKITREKKSPPPEEEVRALMRACQEIIKSNGYVPKQVLNLDETAINFGLGPSHVFAASDA